ncbi:hypothetical protein CAMSH0001_0190 [Campylobacter showae RM3277]|uniref:Uncharacterized protein n=1 Tax=Campylobacter showae RM3277 TaxID=553219 RepID=C6RJ88_9BACT|nr:hypothetical protein CAMSH0001_0190 [Campylobacter showae RM3277]
MIVHPPPPKKNHNKTNSAPNFNFCFSFFPIKYRLKFKE